MASPLDDRSGSPPSNSMQQRILSQLQGDWVKRLNIDQMFILIDGILPFEACLYYQVLPLFLEGNRLNLGMVSPEDTPASEYVRRIVSYLNYSLVPRPISSEALQVVLTSYLNYVGEKQKTNRQQELFSYGHYRHPARKRIDQDLDANARKTLILDSPDDLNLLDPEETIPPDAPQPVPPAPPTSRPIPPAQQPHPSGSDPIAQDPIAKLPAKSPALQRELPDSRSGNLNTDHLNANPEDNQTSAGKDPLSESMLIRALPILDIQANYLTSPVDALAELPPQVMLQELLARVLVGGIGRLYFESHAHYGRILWSQNGVLQSVLEKVPIPVFRGLLRELKQIAHLPVEEQSMQSETEYLYDRARVLLRFRFMVNSYGEEATLQVLRGAALKFYQQQQVAKLERDALGIARQLQNKLKEIRDRAYSEPGLMGAKFEVLPALSQLLHNMEDELDDLGVNRTEYSSPESP